MTGGWRLGEHEWVVARLFLVPRRNIGPRNVVAACCTATVENHGAVYMLNMRYARGAAAVVGVVAASSGSIVGEAFLAAPSLRAAPGRTSAADNKLTFASSSAAPTTTAALPRRRRKHTLAGCAIGMQASPLTPRSPPASDAARQRRRVSGHGRRRQTATAPPCMSAAAAADEGDAGVLGPLRPLRPTEDGSDAFNPNPLDRGDPERARVSGSCLSYLSPSLSLLSGTYHE